MQDTNAKNKELVNKYQFQWFGDFLGKRNIKIKSIVDKAEDKD